MTVWLRVVGLVSLTAMLQACTVIIWLSTQSNSQFSCIQSIMYVSSKSISDSNATNATVNRTTPSLNQTRTEAAPTEPSPTVTVNVSATHEPPRATEISDIFVSVKTTSSFHAERLPPLLSTWLTMFDGKQVHIVTDSKDDPVSRKAEDLGMTVTESNCSTGHELEALCCKSGVEYEQYYAAVDRGEDYRWFCHFDDDIYVHVPNLVWQLRNYDSTDNIYVGHYSILWPAKKVTDKYVENFMSDAKRKEKYFYYALGPSYCISKTLMEKLPQFFRGGSTFESTCDKTGFPDDATVGVIIEHYLGYNLYQVGMMMNELEVPLSQVIPVYKCRQLVTTGYIREDYYYAHKKSHLKYTLQIPMRPHHDDPTGFRSLHCFLFPGSYMC